METKFWEFSLYFPRELIGYFESFKKQLKSILNSYQNCVSISISDDGYCFLMAMPKDAYNKNILFIKDKVIDIILLYYKPKTIIDAINNLDIKSHDNVILIDILSSFDIEDDKREIIKHLSLCKKLYLNSFVTFKLKGLQKRWRETAELLNENSLFMSNSDVKKELIQFLINGVNSKTDYVKLTKNGIEIDNKEVERKSVFYSQLEYDNILFTLINFYPKKIEVEHYKEFDVGLIQSLHELFGGKLLLND